MVRKRQVSDANTTETMKTMSVCSPRYAKRLAYAGFRIEKRALLVRTGVKVENANGTHVLSIEQTLRHTANIVIYFKFNLLICFPDRNDATNKV